MSSPGDRVTDAQHGAAVVVGVDGSVTAVRAVRWGAAEAARRGVPVRLVSAVRGDAAPVAHPELVTRYRDVLVERARAALAEAVAVVGLEAPGLEVESQLVTGHPVAVLRAEADQVRLVVIGDRGLSRVEGLLAGSVSVALATQAACPVVVVRGPDHETSETASLPVVVGVAGSPEGDPAVGFAFESAASRGVGVVAVHAWSATFADGDLAELLGWQVIEDGERRLLAERLAAWVEAFPEVPVERVVARGGPAQALLERAARAQLVVVGSRGRSEFAGLVLGSVSNALLHRAPCPVAVVRPVAAGR